jgi:hypothetical protein
VAAGLLFFGLRDDFENPITIMGIMLGIVTIGLWVAVPVNHSSVKQEIQDYNQQKFIVQHMDFKGMSELRKAQILEPFLTKDKHMRYYKETYDSFWIGIFIPNEECKNIELMKGW